MFDDTRVPFTRAQLVFVVSFALGASIGPLAENLLFGAISFVVLFGVAAVFVVVASLAWATVVHPFEGTAPGIMGSDEWAYSGIVGCVALIGMKLMYLLDPFVTLSPLPSLLFDVITVGWIGGAAAILTFVLSVPLRLVRRRVANPTE